MKKLLLHAGLTLCALTGVEPAFAAPYATVPTDSAASPATRNLYSHLISRRAAATNKMLEGQHLGGVNEVLEFGALDINAHKEPTTNKRPSLVGTRYDSDKKYGEVQPYPYVLDPTLCSQINDSLIAIWHAYQPVIHITAVPRNPWNQNKGREPTVNSANEPIGKLLHSATLTPAEALIRDKFWADADIIADALAELQAEGIPVLFRPFAEFNQSNKYYYKDQNDDDFRALWIDFYDYLVNAKGLHNLLFCWEVWALNRNAAETALTDWYPEGYVDVVGGAYYFRHDLTYLDGNGVFSFPKANDLTIYNFLTSKDRPFGAAQFGLNQNGTPGNGKDDHDFTVSFMNYSTDLAFAYYWTKEQAVENQDHWYEFVTEPRVATDDDLPGFSTLTVTSIAAEDGWVLESTETSGAGGSFDANATGTSALKTGDDSSKRQFKAILSFDTSAIPDGATITSATLQLTRGALYGNPVATLGALNVDIKTGSFATGAALENNDFQAGATQAGVATLAVPGADGSSTAAALNASGLGAIKKTGKTQFRIAFAADDDNDGTGDNVGWYSGDATTPANRPQLTVEYKYQ